MSQTPRMTVKLLLLDEADRAAGPLASVVVGGDDEHGLVVTRPPTHRRHSVGALTPTAFQTSCTQPDSSTESPTSKES